MGPLRLASASALLLAGTAAAGAAACAPGVGPSCRGEVARATQPYRFGARRPAIVKAGPPVAAGTAYCFVGRSRIGARQFLTVSQSELMIDGADVKLPSGCRLDTLDTSEPD